MRADPRGTDFRIPAIDRALSNFYNAVGEGFQDAHDAIQTRFYQNAGPVSNFIGQHDVLSAASDAAFAHPLDAALIAASILLPGVGEVEVGDATVSKDLFYLIDHNVPRYGPVAKALQGMGYNSMSVVRKFGNEGILDPDIIKALNSEYGFDGWRVVTRNCEDFAPINRIPIPKDNSFNTLEQVMQYLDENYGIR